VLGMASLLRLPVRELPDVDSAVVSVLTTYTGAAPGIVDTEITELVEGAVAGIAGIKTISSESRRGRGRTVIEFEPGRDIDEAANDVRDAVARVRGELPEEADEPQITKSDSDSDPVMRTGWRRWRAWRRSRCSASVASRSASGSTAARWRRAT
jgi:multidrug efflux pump